MRALFLAGLLWTTGAIANTAAQQYLKAANVLYQKLEYEKALEQLQRARSSADTVEEDVQVNLWEGILFAELGRLDEARAAFTTALALAGDAKLPIQVSPKVSAEFERLRLGVQKEVARVDRKTNDAPEKPVEVRATQSETLGGGARRFSWLPLAVAGVGVATGVATAVLAKGRYDALSNPEKTFRTDDAKAIAMEGQTLQTVSIVGFGIGAAALTTAALMYFLGAPNDAASVSIVPGRDSLVVGVGGDF